MDAKSLLDLFFGQLNDSLRSAVRLIERRKTNSKDKQANGGARWPAKVSVKHTNWQATSIMRRISISDDRLWKD